MAAPEPEYYHPESTAAELRAAWELGAGLQAVDGLKPSKQAYELAEKVIEGRSTYHQIEAELRANYEKNPQERDQLEADISATRIADIVSTSSFSPFPGALRAIHKRIFDGILEKPEWAGEWRSELVGKPEPAIGGKTVAYDAPFQIEASLDELFRRQQPIFDDPAKDDREAVNQVLRFISGIWRVHPFREGNTRTVATYAVLYLRHLGIEVTTDPFAKHAEYFRDALVLDNAPHRMGDKVPLLLFGAALLDGNTELNSLR